VPLKEFVQDDERIRSKIKGEQWTLAATDSGVARYRVEQPNDWRASEDFEYIDYNFIKGVKVSREDTKNQLEAWLIGITSFLMLIAALIVDSVSSGIATLMMLSSIAGIIFAVWWAFNSNDTETEVVVKLHMDSQFNDEEWAFTIEEPDQYQEFAAIISHSIHNN